MHTARLFLQNYGEPALLQENSTGNKIPLSFKTLKHFLPVWFVEPCSFSRCIQQVPR